jgi:hypothetical protein
MTNRFASNLAATALLAVCCVLQDVRAQTVDAASSPRGSSDQAAALPSTLPVPNGTATVAGTIAPEGSGSHTVGGDVETLASLMSQQSVAALRSTSAGSYEARLLFRSDTSTFYAVLFQKNEIWRVVTTSDERRASSAYIRMVREVNRLSAVEINRVKLEAQASTAQRKMEQVRARIDGMKADLAIAQAEEQDVAARQQELHAQVTAVKSSQRDDQQTLKELRRYIADIQRQLDASSSISGNAVLPR